MEILCVGLGGFIGAISRYLISMQASKFFTGRIPIGTLFVNILGGLLIGFILELNSKTNVISPQMKLFLTTGLMGGLTTFSTFSYETVGLFSDGTGTEWKGLFTGGGFKLLEVQFIGFIATVAWVVVTMVIIFNVLKHTVGLRVSADEEIAGLDIREHGLASSYADFVTTDNMGGGNVPNVMGTKRGPVESPAATQAPAELVKEPKVGTDVHKLTKVVIITRRNKLDDFMQAMNEIGVTGVTITNVLGCGVQKGATAYYRGVEMDMNLLPKVKIEIVVSLVPVEKVVEAAKAVLHTGQIGDGKVFVYDIENVVKIRTGEEGYLALQDTSEE